jgi:hypothetical protein
MKKIFFSAALLVTISLVLFSCGSGDDEPYISENTGVHKIVFEINGDKDVNYTLSFAGTGGTAMAALYDGNNNYMSETWFFPGNATDNSKVICHTDNKASYLTCAIGISTLEVNTNASYSLKAYVNDKLVKELTKTITFTSLSQVEVFSFSTSSLPD